MFSRYTYNRLDQPTHLRPLRALVGSGPLQEEIHVVGEEAGQHDRHGRRQRQKAAKLPVVEQQVLIGW